jgi:MFS family permease
VQPAAYVVWWLADDRYALLAVFASLLGLSYGGYVALGPTVVAELFGVVGLGALLGVLYFGSALGGLLGPPLAGVLAERGDGQTATMTFALAATALAALITLAVRAPSVRTAGGLDPALADHR